MKVRVDADKCQGDNRCYPLPPEGAIAARTERLANEVLPKVRAS